LYETNEKYFGYSGVPPPPNFACYTVPWTPQGAPLQTPAATPLHCKTFGLATGPRNSRLYVGWHARPYSLTLKLSLHSRLLIILPQWRIQKFRRKGGGRQFISSVPIYR